MRVREADAVGRLGLAAVDALDTRTQDLRDVGTGVHRQRQGTGEEGAVLLAESARGIAAEQQPAFGWTSIGIRAKCTSRICTKSGVPRKNRDVDGARGQAQRTRIASTAASGVARHGGVVARSCRSAPAPRPGRGNAGRRPTTSGQFERGQHAFEPNSGPIARPGCSQRRFEQAHGLVFREDVAAVAVGVSAPAPATPPVPSRQRRRRPARARSRRCLIVAAVRLGLGQRADSACLDQRRCCPCARQCRSTRARRSGRPPS